MFKAIGFAIVLLTIAIFLPRAFHSMERALVSFFDKGSALIESAQISR